MTDELRPALRWGDALLYINKLEAEKAELVEALEQIQFGSLEQNYRQISTNMTDQDIAKEALAKHKGEETK